ncbi:hypothetical protein D5S17_21605 [Pseudonocardiaceae bacterium YIM PH 21723]|nr:hypothetical protein D5S17_21605 [Pseudonocardiaceae bacterium YIM PH 21723]
MSHPDIPSATEELDEDQLGVDPLERGMDPAERWAGADREGTTGREQAEGESIERRLAEEEPDVNPVEAVEPDRYEKVETYDLPEADGPGPIARQGRSADIAGGSLAEAYRED